MKNKKNTKSNFAKYKDSENIYQHDSGSLDSTLIELPPNIYKANSIRGMFGETFYFTPIDKKNSLVHFTSGVIAETITKVKNFFLPETIKSYKELNINHKLGLILYGPLLFNLKDFQPIGEKHIATIPTKNGVHLIVKPFDLSKFVTMFSNWSIIEKPEIHKDNPTILYLIK